MRCYLSDLISNMRRTVQHKVQRRKKIVKMTKKIVQTDFNDDTNWERRADGHLKYVGAASDRSQKALPFKANDAAWDDSEHWSTPSHGLNYNYGYGTTGGAGTGVTYDKFNCKHTPDVGCKVGNFVVYPTADKNMSRVLVDQFDVVVPLLDSGFSTSTMVEDYLGLVMWFPIKDMTAPNAAKLRLHAQRINDLARGGNRVAFWCLGSHGRTGTLLATCIGLEEPDIEDPIEEARKRHCKHAVETYAQEVCVFEALGRELPAKYKRTVPKSTIGYTPGGWNGKTTTTPAHVVDNHWQMQCTYCNVKEPTKGIYKFDAIRAHIDCWSKFKDEAKITNSAIPSVIDVSKEDTTELLLPPVVAEDPTVDPESYKQLVKETRPFWSTWDADALIAFDNYLNAEDSFTDLICPECDRLIIDPKKVTIGIIPGQGVMIRHSICSEWATNPDCNELCISCYDTDVSGKKEKVCEQCSNDGN